jgi:membrane protease YdiL (CAAX protease family)
VAKSAPDVDARAAAPEQEPPGGYFHWSRDAAVGLFAVLPLWLLYEGLRWWLAPEDRNGAEVLLLQELRRLGSGAHQFVSIGFGCLMWVAARSLVRRRVPWMRVAGVIALEGTVYALMLGPLAQALASSAASVLAANPETTLVANLVGSLGAGIFEELVFRLALMSALAWIGARAARAWSLPLPLAGVFAVVVSALVFSWFHHQCGQPFDRAVFVYRAMAGVLLGVLMWTRGYGVCVYTHTIYDVYFYLSTHGD